MSLTAPFIRPKADGNLTTDLESSNAEYGIGRVMDTGLEKVTVQDRVNKPVHPLQFGEANWLAQQQKVSLTTARNMQGLHMPLKIGIERFAASQVGRLPCLATRTSNLMLDTLTGDDELISVEDVFNNPAEYPERMGNPHALMEKRLGIF